MLFYSLSSFLPEKSLFRAKVVNQIRAITMNMPSIPVPI